MQALADIDRKEVREQGRMQGQDNSIVYCVYMSFIQAMPGHLDLCC